MRTGKSISIVGGKGVNVGRIVQCQSSFCLLCEDLTPFEICVPPNGKRTVLRLRLNAITDPTGHCAQRLQQRNYGCVRVHTGVVEPVRGVCVVLGWVEEREEGGSVFVRQVRAN